MDLDIEEQAHDNDDDSEDLSIYLSLDMGEEDNHVSDGLDQQYDNDVHEHHSVNRCNIWGECIICFEDFKAGDIIVYSKTCCHVYHKSCMVTYLAIQRRSKRQLIEGTPPLCPICRQCFCTLITPMTETPSSPVAVDGEAHTVDPVPEISNATILP